VQGLSEPHQVSRIHTRITRALFGGQDGGQRRGQSGGEFQVVETDHRQLVGNAQTQLVGGDVDASGDLITGGNDGGGVAAAAPPFQAGSGDQFRFNASNGEIEIRGQAQGIERGLPRFTPLAPDGEYIRTGDQGNMAMMPCRSRLTRASWASMRWLWRRRKACDSSARAVGEGEGITLVTASNPIRSWARRARRALHMLALGWRGAHGRLPLP